MYRISIRASSVLIFADFRKRDFDELWVGQPVTCVVVSPRHHGAPGDRRNIKDARANLMYDARCAAERVLLKPYPGCAEKTLRVTACSRKTPTTRRTTCWRHLSCCRHGEGDAARHAGVPAELLEETRAQSRSWARLNLGSPSRTVFAELISNDCTEGCMRPMDGDASTGLCSVEKRGRPRSIRRVWSCCYCSCSCCSQLTSAKPRRASKIETRYAGLGRRTQGDHHAAIALLRPLPTLVDLHASIGSCRLCDDTLKLLRSIGSVDLGFLRSGRSTRLRLPRHPALGFRISP